MGLFLDHVNVVLSKLREEPITALSSDPTTVAYRTQIAVRRAVAKVWNAKQWTFKLRPYTFDTVASQAAYRLPKLVGEPISVLSSVSPYKLQPIDEDTFDRFEANPTASGNPEWIRFFEMTGAAAQPATASQLTMSSSDATDDAVIFIKGLVNGEVDYEEVTLQGTSVVSTTKTFSAVYALTKSEETDGVVTVLAGATTVGTLAPQEKVLRLRVVRLFPTPSAAVTITVKTFALPPAMTRPYEDSEIPARWDYVVEQTAFAMALQPKGKEQMEEQTLQFNIADDFMADMANEEYTSAEKLIVPERWGGSDDYSWLSSMPGFGVTY